MPQSLSKVYVHIIFSTKHRKNLIDENIEPVLHEYIGGICKGLECNPLIIGGYKDHIHILCLLSRKISQMKLVEEVKKQSSKWIKTKDAEYSNFYWQDGYGIFSINPTQIDVVIKYIENQHEHHEEKSFQDEFRSFLKKYKIEYDERYVWD
ncbi:MAG: transposase [Bacteroidetes bacterium GWF2_38_335]|nr:MAG: transposase [Bacteroidetes bacterium GWF2_38_335]OFY81762.1 MAG: transposase [Bacteroidetes bacterium RIFOXYA12_FULL_38_20]HBS87830.1 IS200/IS605 family transposase [Bacteroidales bacterium]